MDKEEFIQKTREMNRWGFCPICGKFIGCRGKQFSAWPVLFDGVCCEECYSKTVKSIARDVVHARKKAMGICNEILTGIEEVMQKSDDPGKKWTVWMDNEDDADGVLRTLDTIREKDGSGSNEIKVAIYPDQYCSYAPVKISEAGLYDLQKCYEHSNVFIERGWKNEQQT